MDGQNSKNDLKRLIELAKDGDEEAFNRLYEVCFLPISRYISFLVKDKEDVQDLIQDVFLKVYQNLHNYRNKNKSPLGYFYTIARNTIIDYWRKRKIILENSDGVLTRITDSKGCQIELIEKKEISQIINRAIQSLTKEQQEVIVLKFINELPNREISQLLNKSEEAVRQLQSRAIKKLRQKFNELKIL